MCPKIGDGRKGKERRLVLEGEKIEKGKKKETGAFKMRAQKRKEKK